VCQELEKVPAFMTKAPTQEEIDSNPALAALQALKYEDEDPVGKKLERRGGGRGEEGGG